MKKLIVLILSLLVVGWLAKTLIRLSNDAPKTTSSTEPQVSATKTAPVKPEPSSTAGTSPSIAVVAAPASTAIEKPTQPESSQASVYPQMVLSEVIQPGNVFHDSVFGVSATLPEGWSVRHATRWGENNRENTVFFKAPGDSQAVPSMYYQKYPKGAPPSGSAEAYLREIAQGKEASRVRSGFSEYQNDSGSFVYREVGGHPTLSYSATYISQDGDVHAEYFTRILGPGGYVMFFVKGPVKDVQTLIPSVHDMSGTVTTP